jgi:two-component system, OmpR family, sensor histidine kinase QseC
MRSVKFPALRSLRVQLMASYLLALLLTAAAAGLILFVRFTWYSDASTPKGLNMQAHWIEQALQFNADGVPTGLDADRNHPWIYESASEDMKYRVLDAAGTVLLASEPGATPITPPGQAYDPTRPLFRVQLGGLPLDVLTVPIQRAGRTFHIQVARSERLMLLIRRAIGEPVLKSAVWTSVASLLIFGLVVYLTLKRTLRPLREASEAAAHIAPSNLAGRLRTAGLPTELSPLVEAFNQALDRLERGYRVQQDFLAGAAHELKTPLALIRAQIELDGAADRASLLRDVDMMARQVHQLLHLAEVSEAQNYVFEPISLAEVASEVTGYLGRLADLRQVSLQLSSSVKHGRLIEADRSATFVMLKNLVENAIRHSPAGGTVTVAVEATGLHVQDAGSGIAEEDFPKLFARFWRSAERRDDGAGLGLAICHQIASTHGWSLAAQNVTPGARFSVGFGAGVVPGPAR